MIIQKRSSALIISVLLLLISAATHSTATCVDRTASCPLFIDLCEQTTTLHSLCPFTCNRCPEDPCSTTKGGCEQLCQWENGIVTCSCTPGYRLADDKKTCVDVNECTEGPSPCRNDLTGICVNTIGSYSCQNMDCSNSSPGTINYYKSNDCCLPKQETCGINQSIRDALRVNDTNLSPTKRISFGNNASIANWPWMVQITTGGNHLCGATLLTNQWVVTSSECVKGMNGDNLLATLGHVRNVVRMFLDTERSEQRHIQDIIRYPSGVVDGFEQNDIALLKLSAPVNFSDVISPICLPCGEVPRKGDKCWATGFGAIADNLALPLPGILQEVDIPIVGINECIKAFQDERSQFMVNRTTMMCAGYEEGGKDTCDGDAGGPLMCQRSSSCQWYLSGITGFGARCGRKGFYGIYTNVFHFEDWIRTTLGEDASDLCTTDYNPCRLLENEDLGCSSQPDACEGSNRSRCARTCCLRENGREPDCFDNPRYKHGCEALREQCDNPDLKALLEENCASTCAFC